MGGDSPDKLIRLPGEPANPAMPLAHSAALGAVLVANDVADTASSMGDVAGFPFEDGVATGLIFGD